MSFLGIVRMLPHVNLYLAIDGLRGGVLQHHPVQVLQVFRLLLQVFGATGQYVLWNRRVLILDSNVTIFILELGTYLSDH